MDDKKEIIEYAHVNGLMVLEGFDNAVIGIDYQNEKLVYSAGRMIQILIDDQGMSHDESVEYFDYNVVGFLSRDVVLVWEL